MKYISTRGGISPIAFSQAVMMGLADDGGLLLPQSIPDVHGRLGAWKTMTYPQLAMELISLYVDDIPTADLRRLIEMSYGANFVGGVAPLVQAGPLHVLELWHGPTLSFKDVALQLLGNLFEYILARGGPAGGQCLNILGATSGDTGSAAIYGVRGRKGIHIFMMHPNGRISPIQRQQMTAVLDANVHNIAVEGSFDDCQRIMKSLASDLEFKRRYSLGAVNSVNWARVLAQVVYYFFAAFRLQERGVAGPIQFAVPTGNFGDILAGWYAMRMGAPIDRLILATNENDILARFFQSGEYSLGTVYQTLSPAMDIQVASNFERYLYHKVGCDSARLCELMRQFASTGALRVAPGSGSVVDRDVVAGVCSRAECLEVIGRYHRRHGYLLDPHTAVGVAVAERFEGAIRPTICLSTAHPAKFAEAIQQATGNDLAHHPTLDALADLPTRCAMLPNDAAAVRQFIEKVLESR